MMVSSLGGCMLSDSPCAKTAWTTGHPSRCLSVSEVLLQSLHLVCVVVSSRSVRLELSPEDQLPVEDMSAVVVGDCGRN